MSCSRPYIDRSHIDYRGRPIHIPCRTCECCRQDALNMWTSRCDYETTQYNGFAFVTFTYDDEHLPFAHEHSRRPTLDYMHFHRFIDSIRHRAKKIFPQYPNKFSHCNIRFKYIASAEYGDKFRRPHYHCIFFGLDFAEIDGFLQRSWKYGAIKVQPLKPGAFNYVIKYLKKQTYGALNDVLYYSKDLLPPRLFISTGLGSGLYRDNAEQIRKFGYIKKGVHRIYPPAYYVNKYLSTDYKDILAIDYARMSEEVNKYNSYRSFGGSLSYVDWKIRECRLREKRLVYRKYKNLSDVESFDSLVDYDSRPRNFMLDKLFAKLKKLGYFIDGVNDYDTYKDVVPF